MPAKGFRTGLAIYTLATNTAECFTLDQLNCH